MAYMNDNTNGDHAINQKDYDQIYENYRNVMTGMNPLHSKSSKKLLTRNSSKAKLGLKAFKELGSTSSSGVEILVPGEKVSFSSGANALSGAERSTKSRDKERGSKNRKKINFKKKSKPSRLGQTLTNQEW
jgi:hypothetical protein